MFYNAYLPLLAEAHPEVGRAMLWPSAYYGVDYLSSGGGCIVTTGAQRARESRGRTRFERETSSEADTVSNYLPSGT